MNYCTVIDLIFFINRIKVPKITSGEYPIVINLSAPPSTQKKVLIDFNLSLTVGCLGLDPLPNKAYGACILHPLGHSLKIMKIVI